MPQLTAVVDKTNELTAVKVSPEDKAKELLQAILESEDLEHFSSDPNLNKGILAFFHTVVF